MTTLMVPALRSAATRNASGASSIGYRWQHTAHHAEVGAGIVWAADEFDGWPEYVHRRLRGSSYHTAKCPGPVLVRLHFCVPSVGEAGWP